MRTRKSHEHITITVGARRSCHFYPAAPVDAKRAAAAKVTIDEAHRQQRALQLEIDAAIYHSPLDSKPVRARKAPAQLATSAKCGERAMGADDRKTCKRPVAVAIPYDTDGGMRVVAIFGGMTEADARVCRAANPGTMIVDADAADALADGVRLGGMVDRGRAGRHSYSDALAGYRVVIWPSEAMRRGAATVVTVDEDATIADLRTEYPIIATRPAAVQTLIDLHDERTAEYRLAA